ncbi:histidine kinase [Maribacter sp. SA7]|uniref:sensor histidine kinase n=1 Tax=Maribacter zhoushanensis TaxID=3030012 RepID=UPI0023EDCA4E|nr:histidine kinase [Maribacter zhoushanensis]MDF4204646.1 histidine kinase [Maribacter zhoushanensis]
MDRERPRGFMIMPYYRSFVSLAIPYVISAILRMYVEWKRNENLRLSVEKESIKSELQFLKAQLNPHFLFNSLNTIYALSVKKSPDTSEAIVDLSELMRYMIYEADKDLVPLNKEIDYIKSYIQLQRLRLSDSENVSLKITGEDRGRAVPPLLFISFIENAFKYGTDYKGKTYVKITLTITDASVYLNVKNKIGIFKEPTKNSGIGLENIRNQLELIYPGLHNLKVDNDGKDYEVSLTIYQKTI